MNDLLKKLLPTIATVIGGPLAGLAVTEIGKAIGMDAPTVDRVRQVLTDNNLTSEQITQLKLAENALQTRLKELNIDIFKLEIADRDSARRLTIDAKAWTPAALSWLVIIGTFTLYGWLIKFGNPVHLDDVILGRIQGTLDTSFGLVLAYWLGTSYSSKGKDDTISKLSQS